MKEAAEFLSAALRGASAPESSKWLEGASAEVARGASVERFCGLVSLASRYVPRRGGFDWKPAQLAQAGKLLEGWNPERWTVLEAARARLVLARPDLASPAGAAALEEAFRYADMGELCALYKTLALLPEPKRFVWRAGEGCRSSMKSVFESVA